MSANEPFVTSDGPAFVALTPEQERGLVILRKHFGAAVVPDWRVPASNGCEYGVSACTGASCPQAPSEVCAAQAQWDDDLKLMDVRQAVHLVHFDDCTNCAAPDQGDPKCDDGRDGPR